MNLKEQILLFLNKLSPLKLKGDAIIDENAEIKYELSCIINFYKRTDLLKSILHSLADQDLDKNKFELILVEDKGGSEEGFALSQQFSNRINIKYITLEKNFGVMGYSRNYGISKSSGKYILFLDDDTIILKNNFLSELVELFETNNPDGIMPMGIASYCLLKNRYQYHDPFFPTNRCMAYSRKVIEETKGFISDIIGQEDVEFYIRLIIARKNLIEAPNLYYYHPPLIYNDYNKGKAVGYSFANLKNKYPLLICLLILLNGCRYLPLALFRFIEKYKHQSNFSIGFFLGIISSILGNKTGYK